MSEALATNQRQVQAGRYRLLEKLGAGGQGEVWRARDESTGRDVALKVLTGELAQSEAAWTAFEREHAVVSRLDHPSILKVEPPLRDGELVALPMELAAGGDLRKLRGASYLEIVPALIEVAQALEHAHERGVIHRDLKPGNVLLDSSGHARVADFGSAGSAGSAPPKTPLSPFTASPEQLRGDPPSVADDIYGLGALAYELLSGYPPYYPRFEVRRVLEESVPQLKPAQEAPPRLIELVMRMLARRAALRPRSMREVIDELDATLNDTLAFDYEPATQAPATPPRVPLPIAGASPGGGSPVRSGAEALPSAQRNDQPASSPAYAQGRNNQPPGPPRYAQSRNDQPAAPPVHAHGRSEQPAAAAGHGVQAGDPSFARGAPKPVSWDDLDIQPVVRANLQRYRPVKPRRWPLFVLAALALLAFGVFWALPRYAPDWLEQLIPPIAQVPARVADAVKSTPASPPATEPAPASPDRARVEKLAESRATFEKRVTELEARGAGTWGGEDFALARTRAAESVGAEDAGSPTLALERLEDALRRLDAVEARREQALAEQLAAGERALEAGRGELARQAFEYARRIDPDNARAARGLERVGRLDRVLPLLAQGKNAEGAKNYERALRSYREVLEIDPDNAEAKAGEARASTALSEDRYAKAVGAGFAALGAGRLDEARKAFEEARTLRPRGAEAADGLARVNAALRSRDFTSVRQRAAALEAEERWDEALAEYEAALKTDPSLTFAQRGRERARERAELARRLQALIDRPERLAAPAVREEAAALIGRAQTVEPSGPVLRSQIARLEILLPEFDKPVRLALVSDNATQVAIDRVGSFGTFARREISLKPGKYTVIGTRVGFRDVRRDITVAPGQEIQTISVVCVEPI